MKTQMTIAALAIGLFTSTFASSECVHANISTSKPDSIYIDHGDGTVTDSETGLMWQKCAVGLSGSDCSTGTAQTFTWQGAFAAANENADYGYDDWRQPNKKELFSLVEFACTLTPTINQTIFPNTPDNGMWTSSPDLNNSGVNTWAVYFNFGGVFASTKSSLLPIRLVRDSQ